VFLFQCNNLSLSYDLAAAHFCKFLISSFIPKTKIHVQLHERAVLIPLFQQRVKTKFFIKLPRTGGETEHWRFSSNIVCCKYLLKRVAIRTAVSKMCNTETHRGDKLVRLLVFEKLCDHLQNENKTG